MKKIIGLGILLGIITVVFLLVFSDTVIRIGIVGEFSNSTSTASMDTFKAVELAINEIDPEAKKYMIKRYDISILSQPGQLQNKIEHDGIHLLIGPSTSSHFLEIESELSMIDLPVFLPTVSTEEAHNKVDNFFGIAGSSYDQSLCIARVIRDDTYGEKTLILYTSQNIGFSENLAGILKFHIQTEKAGKVTDMIEIGNVMDAKTQEIFNTKFDTDRIVIVAPPGNAGNIAQLAALKNPLTPIYFSEWSKSDTTLEYVNGLENPLYFFSPPPEKDLVRVNQFERSIEDIKKANYNTFSKSSFELMYLVDWVMTNERPQKLSDFQNIIHNMKSYEGVFNDYEFNAYGDGKRGFALYKVVDNSFEHIGGCE